MRKVYVIIITFILLLTGCRIERDNPLAVDGVIDLRSYDLTKDNPVILNGEWNFYWKPESFKTVLSSNDLNVDDKTLHSVPDIWPGKDFGFSIYSLKILTSGDNRSYGLYTVGIGTAAEFYIDGTLVGSNGIIGEDRVNSYPMGYNDIYYFDTDNREIELLVKVSNFHHWKGGIWRPVIIGSEKQIRTMYHKLFLYNISIINVLIVLGIYLIINFFLLGRMQSNLFLGIICLLFASRFIIEGIGVINLFIEDLHRLHFSQFSYTVLTLIISTFILYVRDRFYYESVKVMDLTIISLSLLYDVIILLTPLSFFSSLMPYYQLIILTGVLYVVFVIIRAIKNKREGARIFLYGFILLGIISIHDILITRQIINSIYLLTVGILLFIVSQVIYMSRNSRLKFLRNKTENISAESKKELITNISHEFRTPMNSIIGYLEMVLDSDNLNEQSKEYLTTSYRSSKTLLKLINDFLDLRKIETDSMEVEYNSFNLEFEIRYIIKIIEPLIDGRDITLLYRISDDVPPCIVTDLLKFRQIFINLLNNAIKFTDSGFVELEISSSGNNLIINVIDTGIGMSDEDLEVIFYSFKQLDNSNTRRHSGSGLGLSIASEFVKLLGGRITVTSRIDSGSTFNISLPLTKANCEHSCDERCKMVDYITDDSVQRYLSILVADDVIENTILLKTRLELMGHRVVVANNGAEAVEMAEDISFDLILLDIKMPVMDGYTAAKKIRELNKEIYIFAISANDLEYETEELHSLGLDAIVTKPVDFKDLDKHIKSIIPKYRGSLVPYTDHREEFEEKHSEVSLYGIDIEAGIELWQDELAYYDSLLSFSRKFSSVIPTVESLYENKQFELLYEEIHKIKGVASNLYLIHVQEITGELCTMLKSNDFIGMDKRVELFITEFNRVLTSISRLEKKHIKSLSVDSKKAIKFIERLLLLNKRESLDKKSVEELERLTGEEFSDIKKLLESKDLLSIDDRLKELLHRL